METRRQDPGRSASIFWMIDALPEGGLAPNGLHEAAGSSATDGPAAAAFLTALLARHSHTGERGPVLVCQSLNGVARFGRLYGPGSFIRTRLTPCR